MTEDQADDIGGFMDEDAKRSPEGSDAAAAQDAGPAIDADAAIDDAPASMNGEGASSAPEGEPGASGAATGDEGLPSFEEILGSSEESDDPEPPVRDENRAPAWTAAVSGFAAKLREGIAQAKESLHSAQHAEGAETTKDAQALPLPPNPPLPPMPPAPEGSDPGVDVDGAGAPGPLDPETQPDPSARAAGSAEAERGGESDDAEEYGEAEEDLVPEEAAYEEEFEVPVVLEAEDGSIEVPVVEPADEPADEPAAGERSTGIPALPLPPEPPLPEPSLSGPPMPPAPSGASSTGIPAPTGIPEPSGRPAGEAGLDETRTMTPLASPPAPGAPAPAPRRDSERLIDPTKPTLIFATVLTLVAAIWSVTTALSPVESVDIAQSIADAQSAAQSGQEAPAEETTPAVVAPKVISVSVLSWSDDQGDHPEQAVAMIDGDPATTWHSRWFENNQFRDDSNVTLVVKLEQAATVSSVSLQMDASTSGGQLVVRKVTDPANPRGGTELTTSALSPSTEITLPEPVETSMLALSFRQMPTSIDGNQWAWVSELSVQ